MQGTVAELLLALLDQVIHRGNVGAGDHVLEVLVDVVHAAAHVLDQRAGHGGVAAHLGLHLALAVDQADDGTQAQQLAREGGGSRNTAALLHHLQAEGGKHHLGPGEAIVQHVHHIFQLSAVAQKAGGLADRPAVDEGIGVAIHNVHPQLVAGALLVQQVHAHHGGVVGGAAGGVDAHI